MFLFLAAGLGEGLLGSTVGAEAGVETVMPGAILSADWTVVEVEVCSMKL